MGAHCVEHVVRGWWYGGVQQAIFTTSCMHRAHMHVAAPYLQQPAVVPRLHAALQAVLHAAEVLGALGRLLGVAVGVRLVAGEIVLRTGKKRSDGIVETL